MARKQTRRSISVRGVTYDKLRDYTAAAAVSMSDFIEQRIAEFFAAHPSAEAFPRPAPTIEQSRHLRPVTSTTSALQVRPPAMVSPGAQAAVARRASRRVFGAPTPLDKRLSAEVAEARPVHSIDPATLKVPVGVDDKARSRPPAAKVPLAKESKPRDRSDYRAIRF